MKVINYYLCGVKLIHSNTKNCVLSFLIQFPKHRVVQNDTFQKKKKRYCYIIDAR